MVDGIELTPTRLISIVLLGCVGTGIAYVLYYQLVAEIGEYKANPNRPGVGVVIDAVHQCMTTRGIHKAGVSMVTSQMLGSFRNDARTRAEFLGVIGKGS